MNSTQVSEIFSLETEIQQLLNDIRQIDSEIRLSILSEPPQNKKSINELFKKKEILQKLLLDKNSLINILKNNSSQPETCSKETQTKQIPLISMGYQ